MLIEGCGRGDRGGIQHLEILVQPPQCGEVLRHVLQVRQLVRWAAVAGAGGEFDTTPPLEQEN